MMTPTQLQRAAQDETGESGWSPEVRWLARRLLATDHSELRRQIAKIDDKCRKHEARAEKAEAEVRRLQDMLASARASAKRLMSTVATLLDWDEMR